MIDTHCHLNVMTAKKPEALLNASELDEIGIIIERAAAAGVTRLICVGTSVSESQDCVAIAKKYRQVSATVGVHPCDISQEADVIISELESLITQHLDVIIAVGEIGLDYFHKPFDAGKQAQVFEAQLMLAKKYQLPVVIHIRDAGDDALAILEVHKDDLCGVVHCFSLDQKAAEKIVGWGWYIGIDGPITYPKNHELRSIVATVPLSGILLETDAPFLPPQSLRGKKNCPSNIGIIAEEIARCRNISLDIVINQTTENAKRLFRLN